VRRRRRRLQRQQRRRVHRAAAKDLRLRELRAEAPGEVRRGGAELARGVERARERRRRAPGRRGGVEA